MKESSITRRILVWLNAQPGTWAVKLHGSSYQLAGLPDVLAVSQGRAVFVEVKLPGKKPTAIQEHVHRQIRAAGATVIVATSLEDLRGGVSALGESERDAGPAIEWKMAGPGQENQ